MFVFLLLFFPNLVQAQWTSETFFQVVHLHKFDDTILQGFVHTGKDVGPVRVYGGVWIDQDTKTGKKEAYTDAQVSPLLGAKGPLWLKNILPSRAFTELRYVQRTVTFPDERPHSDWEARAGLLGYDFVPFKSPFFLEHYYALFYSRMYDDRLLLQGWTRQGLRFAEHFDVFNEFLADTFDQSRGQDATVDLRPGVRLHWRQGTFSAAVLHQYIHHFSNLAFAGRSEQRTTLVVGHSW